MTVSFVSNCKCEIATLAANTGLRRLTRYKDTTPNTTPYTTANTTVSLVVRLQNNVSLGLARRTRTKNVVDEVSLVARIRNVENVESVMSYSLQEHNTEYNTNHDTVHDTEHNHLTRWKTTE